MAQPVHEHLSKLYHKLGKELFQDPEALGRHLRRLCQGSRHDGDSLAACVELEVPQILLGSQMAWEDLEPILVKQVIEDRPLRSEDVRWAVRSWAVGLGRVSLAEADPEPPKTQKAAVSKRVYTEFAPQESVMDTAANWLVTLAGTLFFGALFGGLYGAFISFVWAGDYIAEYCAERGRHVPQNFHIICAIIFSILTAFYGFLGSVIVLVSDIEADTNRMVRNALVGAIGALAAWTLNLFGLVWCGFGVGGIMMVFLLGTFPLGLSRFLRTNFYV
jgi:hypothetical protein